MGETQTLTFRYKLLPTRGQHRRLRAALDHTRDLYNAALQERIDCYRKTGRALSYFGQTAGVTTLRAEVEWTAFGTAMQYWPLRQVDFAFKAFFRRVKLGEKPGFPRFRGAARFKTFGFTTRDGDGWRVRDNRLVMKGVGAIRLHMDRPLPSKPISCKVKCDGRHWHALLTVEVPCTEGCDRPAVGIDVGLASLATLSTGETISNPRPYLRAQRELRRRQRALARCKRGSVGRHKARERVAAAHAKTRRVRNTHLHQASAAITKQYGLIAVEDLNVKGLARSRLSKSVHDAAWTKFIQMLDYKATKAGGRLIKVDPKFTSQTCPDCGNAKPKTLAERTHRCECGCVLDRDVAAARVILQRGVLAAKALNVGQWPERAPGKLAFDEAETVRELPQGTGKVGTI